jgi:adenosylcobinamide kinase/adenosylcobinamide-phosphate guanylyltransferase
VSRVLVLGGSRSGKSDYAESLLAEEHEVVYVATAVTRPGDDEWGERIRRHRDRRRSAWHTLETGDVAAVLAAPGPPVLIDSVTTWLAAAMDASGCWAGELPGELDRRIERFVAEWQKTTRHAIAVSDEVGLGIVPDTAAGRRFRDSLGLLNQRLAAAADEVHLVVAGLPMRLK